jgi:hypothetical protein
MAARGPRRLERQLGDATASASGRAWDRSTHYTSPSPGLLVVQVAAADDDTALAFQDAGAARWATAAADRATHEPGQPGVRLCFYLDLRQELGTQHQFERCLNRSCRTRPWPIRNDKRACHYQALVTLTCLRLWLP